MDKTYLLSNVALSVRSTSTRVASVSTCHVWLLAWTCLQSSCAGTHTIHTLQALSSSKHLCQNEWVDAAPPPWPSSLQLCETNKFLLITLSQVVCCGSSTQTVEHPQSASQRDALSETWIWCDTQLVIPNPFDLRMVTELRPCLLWHPAFVSSGEEQLRPGFCFVFVLLFKSSVTSVCHRVQPLLLPIPRTGLMFWLDSLFGDGRPQAWWVSF